MDIIKLLIELVTVIVAILTVWQAWKAYSAHNITEYHKLFSQLNKRYENNEDMQDVVRYLRDKEPSDKQPSLYQLEVFLRFFEELGLYMKTDSIKSEDVNRFFGYYLRQVYTSPRGKKLLLQLGEEEKDLELLQLVKTKLNIK